MTLSGKKVFAGCRPFLLQSKASYTQIGIFSVASYPYSFKLLWSPIVDSIYSLAFGRRKSWVVPIQLGSSVILLASATWLAGRSAAPVYPIHTCTCVSSSCIIHTHVYLYVICYGVSSKQCASSHSVWPTQHITCTAYNRHSS